METPLPGRQIKIWWEKLSIFGNISRNMLEMIQDRPTVAMER